MRLIISLESSPKKTPETEFQLKDSLLSLQDRFFPPEGGGVHLSDPLLRDRLVERLGEFRREVSSCEKKKGVLTQSSALLSKPLSKEVVRVVQEALRDQSVWDRGDLLYKRFTKQAPTHKAGAVIMSLL